MGAGVGKYSKFVDTGTADSVCVATDTGLVGSSLEGLPESRSTWFMPALLLPRIELGRLPCGLEEKISVLLAPVRFCFSGISSERIFSSSCGSCEREGLGIT